MTRHPRGAPGRKSPISPASIARQHLPHIVLPDDYSYYDVPERYHVRPEYRYTVINHRPVIVEPRTRRVVEVVE